MTERPPLTPGKARGLALCFGEPGRIGGLIRLFELPFVIAHQGKRTAFSGPVIIHEAVVEHAAEIGAEVGDPGQLVRIRI